MESIYDFVALALFAGLILLFLQRSVANSEDDPLWPYLIASIGCAVFNYLGNAGFAVVAMMLLAILLLFIFWVLKPIRK